MSDVRRLRQPKDVTNREWQSFEAVGFGSVQAARAVRRGGRARGCCRLCSRGGDAVYQQLTGSRNVFTAVVVVPAVDMPPVEIRAITFITGVGQSDPIVMPGVAPRGHGNDDFHS